MPGEHPPDIYILQGGQDNVQDYRLAVQQWMPQGQNAGRSRNDRRFRYAKRLIRSAASPGLSLLHTLVPACHWPCRTLRWMTLLTMGSA